MWSKGKRRKLAEMNGLIIDEPWISKILVGEKSWELRSTSTRHRGRIALIRKGGKAVVGTAELVAAHGPYAAEELAQHTGRHQVPATVLAEFARRYRGRLFAWELAAVRRIEPPLPYTHPSGAVIWVKLPIDLLGADREDGTL